MSFWAKCTRAWRGRLQGTDEHPFDRATGMDTSGYQEGGAYYGTAPSLFCAVMERWGGDPAGATFVDLGCGKGRVLLLASRMPFELCVGVELDPTLAAIAWENSRRWTEARCAIAVVCADAAEVRIPLEGRCVVYLFHPFPAEVLERVLGNLEADFRGRAGELELLYVNAEFDAVLERRPQWERVWRMPVEMSAEDKVADLLYTVAADGRPAFADAHCSGWRWHGASGHEAGGAPDPVHYG